MGAFAERRSVEQIEEGLVLAPRFDEHGLLPVVATDAGTGQVLMFAYMNAEALQESIRTGHAVYFSRSRNELWRKGATSGHSQRIVDLRVDCDQDSLWISVDTGGTPQCHTGYDSCYYRGVPLGEHAGEIPLEQRAEKSYDPRAVYGDTPGSTRV